MLKYLVFSCAIILSIDLNAAFQGGAPVEVCQTLMPNHGVEPQTVASPFLIRVSGNAKIRSTGSLNVTIQGKDEFKGFILQARESKKNTIIGSFEPSSKAKLLDCSPGKSVSISKSCKLILLPFRRVKKKFVSHL